MPADPPPYFLLHNKDRESGSSYADLAGTEDFLASHVLRVAGGIAPGFKDGPSTRENKGKARQYLTINARTVVIKDSFLYSNKGFKSLNQAQLLSDALYYPDISDNQQWVVYYISKPLLGSPEPIIIVPAILRPLADRQPVEHAKQSMVVSPSPIAGSSAPALAPRKKQINTFADLLDQFPIISHNMTPGLETIFKEWSEQFGSSMPQKPSRPPSVLSHDSSTSLQDSLATLRSSVGSDSITLPNASLSLDPEEDNMRTTLEAGVTRAIDLFQGLDKQQLTLVGTTTNLSGPSVERLIERYVVEHIHDRGLFSRICQLKRDEDSELDSRIRRMQDIDVAQVGIPIEGGQSGKRKLASRIDRAVAVFKKQKEATSPQDMTTTLLSTQKIIASGNVDGTAVSNEDEKQALSMTMNADTLVSMLLLVVIRSGVRHLHARLSYMKHFVFTDEVETGEIGYALSTFEAVLLYLTQDSGPLRRASHRNSEIWGAVKQGNLPKLQSTLEPYGPRVTSPMRLDGVDTGSKDNRPLSDDDDGLDVFGSEGQLRPSRMTLGSTDFAAVGGSLEHVFPFQKPPTPPPEESRPKRKRVVMKDVRSESVSSVPSSAAHSRRASSNSAASDTENPLNGDTSLEVLVQTQNTRGESLLMMAVEGMQHDVLRYLLSLEEYFPLSFVLEDCNTEGTTLLSAAVQLNRRESIDMLLDHVLTNVRSHDTLRQYFSQQDSKGRSVGHYLFNVPTLLSKIGALLAWRLKDNNGQTPLFALCRSYDHPQYHSMVGLAIELATRTQPDHGPLHLDDHVDGKGNTILHVVNDPTITYMMLQGADVDVNATNDKKFTPFMVVSKYGKIDLARVIFSDPRTELLIRDLRGLTAIDLAKDDDIRNRIDDMVLLSRSVGAVERVTTVVRSYYTDDAVVRLVLKSGEVNATGSMTVTTCRRSLGDFVNLASWLSTEQPASWLPTQFMFASPFMIPSKPSRSVLRDIQLRLDNLLRCLLTHSTFATHELVWEFFLVPDIDPQMLADRSKQKAEVRVDKVRDEYDPVTDTAEVELFVSHAYEQVKRLATATRALVRRVNRVRQAASDVYDLSRFSSTALSTLAFLPQTHKDVFERYIKCLAPTESEPMAAFYYAQHSMSSTSQALLVALHRPTNLIGSMEAARHDLDRTLGSLQRQNRWTPNIGFFDETRRAIAEESRDKAEKTRRALDGLGSELRYTQQTVAAELAGWQETRVGEGRKVLRELARATLVKERDRLDSMKRALRQLRLQTQAQQG